jgi:hypothetical protein
MGQWVALATAAVVVLTALVSGAGAHCDCDYDESCCAGSGAWVAWLFFALLLAAAVAYVACIGCHADDIGYYFPHGSTHAPHASLGVAAYKAREAELDAVLAHERRYIRSTVDAEVRERIAATATTAAIAQSPYALV